jgi:tetratricopeptide (TPR) repeat protein
MSTGDYNAAVRFGQEALSLARALGDRATEVVATTFLGVTRNFRGEFSDAAALFERNVVALEGDLRNERFGTAWVHSAFSEANLCDVISQLGRFDEAIEHGEVALRIAETADHPLTLSLGLFSLGVAHLRRGDLPRATPVLARSLDFSRTWQFVIYTPLRAAALGAAYVLAGRAEEALPLVAGAVEEFRSRQMYTRPAAILLCAGMTYLSAGRIDEAASHAREALALTRRLGARGSEAHALCLAGDVASAGGAEAQPVLEIERVVEGFVERTLRFEDPAPQERRRLGDVADGPSQQTRVVEILGRIGPQEPAVLVPVVPVAVDYVEAAVRLERGHRVENGTTGDLAVGRRRAGEARAVHHAGGADADDGHDRSAVGALQSKVRLRQNAFA